MQKLIILAISSFAICYSQEFDYSNMSNTEKILMYKTMKKTPLNTAILNHFVPGYGFFMLGNELDDKTLKGKGLVINGLKFASILTAFMLHDIYKDEEQYQTQCLFYSIENSIEEGSDSDWNSYDCNLDTGPMFLSKLALGLYLGISAFESYYILNKAKEYNHGLYKAIFGVEPPNIRASLYPLQDGAGISFTYSFN